MSQSLYWGLFALKPLHFTNQNITYIHIYEVIRTGCKNVKLVLTRLVRSYLNSIFNFTGKNMKVWADFQIVRKLIPFYNGFIVVEPRFRTLQSPLEANLEALHICSEPSWTKLFNVGGAALWLMFTSRMAEYKIKWLKLNIIQVCISQWWCWRDFQSMTVRACLWSDLMQ